MKTVTLEDLGSADLLIEKEPILLEQRGVTVAVLYSLGEPEKLPLDVKRQLFAEFATEMGEALDARGVTEDEILRDFAKLRAIRRRDALPPEEGAEHTDMAEHDVEPLWSEEACRRAHEIIDGTAEEIPGDVVMAQARALLA